MTWIKPSFLWLMARSGWARKPGQEVILSVHISREGWEEALSQAVLTHADHLVYRDSLEWRTAFKHATVHVQWDPERTLHGQPLDARSIQVGLSRHIIDRYVDEWILNIQDMTPLARKIHGLVHGGETAKAKTLLPRERVYRLEPELAKHIGADS
jgi:hypothetical protein